jgi:hypothetical protein
MAGLREPAVEHSVLVRTVQEPFKSRLRPPLCELGEA